MNEKNKNDKITVPLADLEQNFSNESLRTKKVEALDSQCCIHLCSRRKRLADADGISGKAAIDGLIHGGLLIDDSPEYVKEVRFTQEKIKKNETEETLIEIWV